MAFGDFHSVSEVARTYRITFGIGQFIQPLPLAVSESFQQRLRFFQEHAPVRMSEASICEFLIAPVLQELWLSYSDELTFWSHAPLGVEEPLMGIADYYFSKRSPLGLLPEQPYVLVIEAKKDDFDTGWGQCLAIMLAAQRMNTQPDEAIYGCVSSGDMWQFGKLEAKVFTREFRRYVLSDLSELFAGWNYILAQAKKQATATAA